MVFYELDERSITGIEELDRLHVEIADLSQTLGDLLDSDASFDEVHKAFHRFKSVLITHFDFEEDYLQRLGAYDDVRAHLRRHKDSHDEFRNLLTYAEAKFGESGEGRKVPNVVALIPPEYFEELKDLDTEMNSLVAKYSVTEEVVS